MAITPSVTSSRDDSGVQGGSSNRDELINYNVLVGNIAGILDVLVGDNVVVASTLSRGTTVTIASTAGTIRINGDIATVGALTAQAFGALGTIPASKWGIIAMERVLAGTATFTSGTANYTTGYATEAAAIAALPAQSADKVQVGYVTVLATASTWVAGTDALAGGTGGTPATTTNYYSIASSLGATALTAKQIGNMSGQVITS